MMRCCQCIAETVRTPRGGPGHYCGGVIWRWWKKKTPGRILKVRSRADADQVSRIDLTDLVPPAADFLAHSAAAMLVLSGEYARAGRQAWSAVDQDALARATQISLQRYNTLHQLLSDYVPDATEAMVGPLTYVKEQAARMVADRWFERVATSFVVGGFLTDFYRILAQGLPTSLAEKVTEALSDTRDEDLCGEVLGRVVDLDVQYVSRVSLWSRRLVGDAMLIARNALPRVNQVSSTGDRFEPLFTDILASHSERLSRLGLTA